MMKKLYKDKLFLFLFVEMAEWNNFKCSSAFPELELTSVLPSFFLLRLQFTLVKELLKCTIIYYLAY